MRREWRRRVPRLRGSLERLRPLDEVNVLAILPPDSLNKLAMTKLACKIRRGDSKHKGQSGRANRTRRRPNAKHEAQNDPPFLGCMKAQNHWNRHRENPQIRRHVGDIRKIRKGLLVDAFPPSFVPPRLDGPTSKAQHNLHDDDPGADKTSGADDEISECAGDENAVV